MSQLDNNKAYWVRLTVTDGDGNDNLHRFALRRHRLPLGNDATPDLAMVPKQKPGCEIGPNEAPARGLVSTLAVLATLAAAFYVARRAARRG